MKGQPVDQLVYDYIFPNPKNTDPQSFQGLLQRNLIPEVRQETQSFYGHLDTQEAKYPGLDYAHPTHRIRLSRWPWHRRLFRAFDGLGLTRGEIARLTKWEGTKWAKEKFEKEQGIVIRDTAADGFPDWIEPVDRFPTPVINAAIAAAAAAAAATPALRGSRATRSEGGEDDNHVHDEDNEDDDDDDVDDDDDDDDDDEGDEDDDDDEDEDEDDDDDEDDQHDDDDDEEEDEEDEEDEDVGIESVGVELNNRLRIQAARRDAGDTSVVLDEEWEQWFKNALETGELSLYTERLDYEAWRDSSFVPANASATSATSAASLVPPGELNMARGGMETDQPELLQSLLRRAFERDAEAAAAERATQQRRRRRRQSHLVQQLAAVDSEMRAAGARSRANAPWTRRRFSELRLPTGDAAPAAASQRTAEASGA